MRPQRPNEARSAPANGGAKEKRDANNICVLARFRPQNASELAKGGAACIELGSDGQSVRFQGTTNEKHTFTFDRVFGESCTQEEVYEYAARPIVEDVLQGYNGTVFAYGQTSSGKTHTMQGPSIEDSELRGVIPRMVEGVFEGVQRADAGTEFLVKVSYFEIYLERIRDLFDPGREGLAVREERGRGVWVEGATEIYVSSEAEVLDLMREGAANRAVAATRMNAESSRSHAVLVVSIVQRSEAGTRSGKLHLVDLAGSEKVGKTGAEGQALEEAKNINRSLSALGNVINALTDGRGGHVPYRDSKLTRVLQEALGGNSRTALVCCASPAAFNEAETLSTLRFGARAKCITNRATVNRERSAADLQRALAAADAELARCRARLAALEGPGASAAPAPRRRRRGARGACGGAGGALREREARLQEARDVNDSLLEQIADLADEAQRREADAAALRAALDAALSAPPACVPSARGRRRQGDGAGGQEREEAEAARAEAEGLREELRAQSARLERYRRLAGEPLALAGPELRRAVEALEGPSPAGAPPSPPSSSSSGPGGTRPAPRPRRRPRLRPGGGAGLARAEGAAGELRARVLAEMRERSERALELEIAVDEGRDREAALEARAREAEHRAERRREEAAHAAAAFEQLRAFCERQRAEAAAAAERAAALEALLGDARAQVAVYRERSERLQREVSVLKQGMGGGGGGGRVVRPLRGGGGAPRPRATRDADPPGYQAAAYGAEAAGDAAGGRGASPPGPPGLFGRLASQFRDFISPARAPGLISSELPPASPAGEQPAPEALPPSTEPPSPASQACS
eukprot:tig00000037_g10097.t1